MQLELPVPRSVIILSPLLLVIVMGGARAVYRNWRDGQHAGCAPSPAARIIGAGEAAVALIRELQRAGEWRVVGLLDDDATKHRRELLGHRVLGSLDELPRLYSEFEVRDAIIAMPEADARTRRQAATACLRAGIRGMTVPALADLMNGRVTLSSVRNLNLDDLLGREAVSIDTANVQQMISGRVVMVTGAAGSIGSEICRQLARFQPGEARVLRPQRVRALSTGRGVRLRLPECAVRSRDRRRQGRAARGIGAPPVPAFGGLPRRRLQARADDGRRQRLGSRPEQHARNHDAVRRGGAVGRRALRAGLDRQGRQPDQRDGRQQAAGRTGVPGAAAAGDEHAVRRRALRQRRRQRGQRHPEVPGADREGRAADGHASRT